MAEVLLRRRLEQAGVAAAVSSAGLYPSGRPATGHAVAVMADRGLDLGSHRSRHVDADLLWSADLIVCMAREHVRELSVLDRAALDRAFTLKELVRAAATIEPRGASEPLDDWLRRLGAARKRDDLIGVGFDPDLDVADPVGRGRADYEATADELERLLERLVELVWPATAVHRGRERSA